MLRPILRPCLDLDAFQGFLRGLVRGSDTNSVQTRFLHQQNKANRCHVSTVNRSILLYDLYYGPRKKAFRGRRQDILVKVP